MRLLGPSLKKDETGGIVLARWAAPGSSRIFGVIDDLDFSFLGTGRKDSRAELGKGSHHHGVAIGDHAASGLTSATTEV